MSAKKTDNRARPKIHRTDDKHDKALRDWAAEQGIEPWQALETAIRGLKDPGGPEIDRLRNALEISAGARRLEAADLESAREATRRADAEVERLARELAKLGALKSAEIAPVIERFKSAFGADIPQAPSGRAATQPCACALPAELDQRVRARIAARPGRDLAFIVKNGCDRLEASDGYQDRQKAARKARS